MNPPWTTSQLAENPFRVNVEGYGCMTCDATSRLEKIRSFTKEQCIAALNLPHAEMQTSVRRALAMRLLRLCKAEAKAKGSNGFRYECPACTAGFNGKSFACGSFYQEGAEFIQTTDCVTRSETLLHTMLEKCSKLIAEIKATRAETMALRRENRRVQALIKQCKAKIAAREAKKGGVK